MRSLTGNVRPPIFCCQLSGPLPRSGSCHSTLHLKWGATSGVRQTFCTSTCISARRAARFYARVASGTRRAYLTLRPISKKIKIYFFDPSGGARRGCCAAAPPRFAWRAPRRAAASRQQGLTTLGNDEHAHDQTLSAMT